MSHYDYTLHLGSERAHVRAKIPRFVQAYFATRIRFVRKRERRRILLVGQLSPGDSDH